ncbi:ANTAR domain-containing protein [Actinomycetospora sp. CA-101289]|uniref:ANTAR domain-containing protein n=1 Tax=Actinomycetospora sp. CA-101289 TaxID=3239893 RepID=UPI003D97E784
MPHRDLIGQAKGLLRERFEVDDEDAFRMLVKSSQNTNVELTAVAPVAPRQRRRLGCSPRGGGAR